MSKRTAVTRVDAYALTGHWDGLRQETILLRLVNDK